MQVEDHAGYKTGDVWTRWLPEYDERSYQAKVAICRTAIAHWMEQKQKASAGYKRVKTDIAEARWGERLHWCRVNIRRWQNSLRDVMIDEGTLNCDTVPF